MADIPMTNPRAASTDPTAIGTLHQSNGLDLSSFPALLLRLNLRAPSPDPTAVGFSSRDLTAQIKSPVRFSYAPPGRRIPTVQSLSVYLTAAVTPS
jgi:hypothetical protein